MAPPSGARPHPGMRHAAWHVPHNGRREPSAGNAPRVNADVAGLTGVVVALVYVLPVTRVGRAALGAQEHLVRMQRFHAPVRARRACARARARAPACARACACVHACACARACARSCACVGCLYGLALGLVFRQHDQTPCITCKSPTCTHTPAHSLPVVLRPGCRPAACVYAVVPHAVCYGMAYSLLKAPAQGRSCGRVGCAGSARLLPTWNE
jgi:hypothetical protein